MSTTAQQPPPTQLATALQYMVASEQSLVSILAQATEGLCRIQSLAFASGLDENMSAMAPQPVPQNIVWQVPSLMQRKAKRRVGNWQDAYAVLAHSQQQMLAWASQSLLDHIGQASGELTKINGVLFSRRQSAQIINFADRRASQASPSASQARPPHARQASARAA